MSELTFGVIGTSKKEDELRVPIHPDHLKRLTKSTRENLIFEEGYGAPFGWTDAEITAQTGGVAPRAELLSELGNVIIAKPTVEDLGDMREGGILWGYPHARNSVKLRKSPSIANLALWPLRTCLSGARQDKLAATRFTRTMKWRAIARFCMRCALKASTATTAINARRLSLALAR